MFLIVVSSAYADEEGRIRASTWDPSSVKGKEAYRFDEFTNSSFGKGLARSQDGRDAMGGKSIERLSLKEKEFSGWKLREGDGTASRWREKSERPEIITMKGSQDQDWRKEADMRKEARGFEGDYRTSESRINKDQLFTDYIKDSRFSRKEYSGPELDAIQRQLKEDMKGLEADFEDENHQLSVEKIRELLNKE